MTIILLLIRLILFAIFALAGVGKLLDLKGSEKAVKAFGTPEEFAKFFAIGLPCAELVFAVCLLFVETSWVGAIGAMILLLTFIGGMIWQLAQGNAPDCHCFGAIHSEPVSKKSLIRNVVFAVLAFVLILSGKANQGASLFDSADNSQGNVMSVILGLATVGLLAVGVFYLNKISEQQTQIMRRIEILEVTAIDGGREVLREDVSAPTTGLPIGAPAPDFVLPDVNNKQTSFENLLMQTKPMLFLFVSPTCKPCAALLPEIEKWQAELKGKLNFIFVSNGNVKDNLEKFAGETFKQVLLQNDREIALQFGAEWTPTAVLVNADGTIASRTAVGDKAIRDLVDTIKEEIDRANPLLIGNKNDLTEKLGEDAPEFFENDINDKLIASADLRGKKTLIAYWSLTCGFCDQMLGDLQDWDTNRSAGEPDLLLISSGEIDAHRKMNLHSPIILDETHKIAAKLGMTGTPSAVLIDENGKIASEVVIGSERILSLIGKRK